MPFDRIAEAVASGEVEAGVMIHEELLYYPRLVLHWVVDLGAEWCQRNGLRLPIGLNVIRRDLPHPLCRGFAPRCVAVCGTVLNIRAKLWTVFAAMAAVLEDNARLGTLR